MKNLENKILEELNSRILLKDKELQEKEEFKLIQETTVEALRSLTSLSESELDKIVVEVHNDVSNKYAENRKKNLRLLYLGFSILFVLSLFLIIKNSNFIFLSLFIAAVSIFFYKKTVILTKERKILIDYFDNKNLKWPEGIKLKQNRRFENGKYIFQTDTDDWCYWDTIPIDLPDEYQIELESKWIKGLYGKSGVVLLNKDSDRINFEINGKGSGSYSIKNDGEFIANKSWRDYMGKRHGVNKQIIKINKNKFEYYIGGSFVYSGEFKMLGEITDVGLIVCDKQTVEFHEFAIKDTKKNKTIFKDDFNKPDINWTPKHELNYKKSVIDGKYVFSCEREDWCYWSYLSIDFSGNCDFILKANWLEGETNYFGFMLWEENDKYFFFKVNADGEACIDIKKNDKYIGNPGNINTGQISNKDTPIYLVVKIRNRKITYYVNDFLVDTTVYKNRKHNKIAVRVCGIQTVAFEKLIIEEK